MFKKIVALLLGLQFLTFPAGATTTYKICSLPDIGSLADSDHFELSRNCAGSYQATAAEMAAYILTKAPGATNQVIINSGGIFTSAPSATVKSLLGLSSVASTGSYLDLTNRPAIPAGQVNSDWNATTGLAQILNKPALGTASGYAASAFLQASSNLSDVASPPAALTNLGFTPLGKALAALPSLPAAGLVVGNGSAAPASLTGTATGQVPTWNGTAYVNAVPGNVTGPPSSTDRTLPRISGTAGSALLASNILVSDNDEISGYRQLVVQDASAARTLAATDRGATLRFTGSASVTVTLPNSLLMGFSVEIIQAGTGQITFATASGATLNNAHGQTKTYGQHAAVRLLVTQNTDGASANYNLAGDTGL